MIDNNTQITPKTIYKKTHLIIFSVISFFAIHNMIFLNTFEINFPYSVDFSDEFNDIFYFITEGKERFFATKGFHIIFFPKLISYPFLYITNFDVTHLYYLQWVVNSATLYVFYLIIKQTDKKLFWTLIPISLFLYNPLTSSGYWAISLLPWLFAMFGITLTVYFLNKKKIIFLYLNLAILSSILSTFSIVVGVVAWFSGFILLIKNYTNSETNSKKFLIIWTSSIIIVGAFYLSLVSNTTEPFHFEMLFTPAGFSFITHYIASSFRLKFELLMILVGSASLIISCFITYYFLRKELFKNYLPWFVFISIGIIGAIITAIGRMQFLDTHLGNEPYYSPISQLFQIGLIVLSGKLIYESKKLSKKNILVILFVSLIILQMVLLIPSYYAGWQRGEHYFNEKTEYVSCFSLKTAESCKLIMPTLEHDFLEMINYLVKNQYSIFDESKFSESHTMSVSNFYEYENYDVIFSKNLEINLINNIQIEKQKSIKINEPIISLEGSIISNDNWIIDELYLVVDDQVLLKINDFDMKTSKINNMVHISWSSYFMSGYLENGCHNINIVNIHDSKRIHDDGQISICI